MDPKKNDSRLGTGKLRPQDHIQVEFGQKQARNVDPNPMVMVPKDFPKDFPEDFPKDLPREPPANRNRLRTGTGGTGIARTFAHME